MPGLMVLAAVGVAAVLATKDTAAPSFPLIDFLLPSDADGARAVLQVVAGSVITVTSVVFSLTVVALQITAGNYSPRVLRTFLRDFGTQVVLGTFLATFTLTYLVLQNIRPLKANGGPGWAPELAFIAIPVFVAGSLAALVFFIHHVTQSIRVDLIVGEVLDDLLTTIRNTHGPDTEGLQEPHVRDIVPEHAQAVTATASGFVQSFGVAELIETLSEVDGEAAFRPTVGDHVLEGATIGWVWARSEGEQVPNEIAEAAREAIHIGRERSVQQDVAFGIRQLVDVAVRALSPGVNDPNTAVTVIEHLSVAYRELLQCGAGPIAHLDEDGDRRVIAPYPTLEEYLHISTQQIGHYGSGDMMVVLRLLRTLGQLKGLAPPQHHEALDRQIQWVLRDAEVGLDIDEHVENVRIAAGDALGGSGRFRHYTAAG